MEQVERVVGEADLLQSNTNSQVGYPDFLNSLSSSAVKIPEGMLFATPWSE